MFKSVFAKYVTAFMTILTCGFIIILLIVTSIVSHYSGVAKTDFMNQVAEVMRGTLADEAEHASSASFSKGLDQETTEELDRLLSAFAGDNKDELSFWVTDGTGSVLYTKADDTLAAPIALEALPISDILSLVQKEGAYSETVYSPQSNRNLLICARGLFNTDGKLCGTVIAGSANVRLGSMAEDLTQTVITSALLVILAALIAAYFITERTVQPLREMNHAARDFAAGKFDRRVVVRGKDEVSELAEAFNQMAESLEHLETMRTSFVANISHDLRTPMTTIAGFIDGIRDGVIPEEERDHYLEVVSLEVRRLSRLVASLLDLSRIQAGDRKFVMQPFDVCEMARVILISFEQKIEEKKLDVAFECDRDRMFVSADHDAIYQVFYNLCHNAVKFSKEGGLLQIEIKESADQKIEISVYNEGQGIAEEDIPMIFDRFYKSDKSRSLDKTGTGLGLYISKTIIAAHGEKIRLESESGKSCTFFFTLTRSDGTENR